MNGSAAMQKPFRTVALNTSNTTRYHRHAAVLFLLGALLLCLAPLGHMKFARLMMDRAHLVEVLHTLGHARRDLVIEQADRSMRAHEMGQTVWPSSEVGSWAERDSGFKFRFDREGDRLLAEGGRNGAAYAISLEVDHHGDEAPWAIQWRCSNQSPAANLLLLISLCPPAERKALP